MRGVNGRWLAWVMHATSVLIMRLSPLKDRASLKALARRSVRSADRLTSPPPTSERST